MTHSYINPIWPPITQLQFLHLPSQASDRSLTMTAHDTNVHKEIQGIFPTDSLVYHWIQTIAMAQSGNTEKYSGQWSCFISFIFYISLPCFCSRCLCQTMSNPAFLPSRPQGATATGALKLHRAGRLHRFEAAGVETLRAISGAGSGFRPLQLWLLGDLGHPQVPMPAWNFPLANDLLGIIQLQNTTNIFRFKVSNSKVLTIFCLIDITVHTSHECSALHEIKVNWVLVWQFTFAELPSLVDLNPRFLLINFNHEAQFSQYWKPKKIRKRWTKLNHPPFFPRSQVRPSHVVAVSGAVLVRLTSGPMPQADLEHWRRASRGSGLGGFTCFKPIHWCS